jgi:hypothetical protein
MNNCMFVDSVPHPGYKLTAVIIALLFVAATSVIVWLLSIEDSAQLNTLIEDDGPVQLFGQVAIALAFALSLFYAIVDRARYGSYLLLSYILMFYTLREADYHYKLSEYAKATQFKRFFSHELIPISSKLFLASIVILFLVVAYRYVKAGRTPFLLALKARLPWAIFLGLWFIVFFLSQAIDQIPYFHTSVGQVYEEVFEASAEVLMLGAVILFRIQLRGNRRAGSSKQPIPQ